MADDTALVWKALADPTRRAILDLLRERAHHRGAERRLPGAHPVRRHEAPGGAGGGRAGRRPAPGAKRWNHLNGVPLREAYERWMRPYADRWAESLLRLKETAERREGAGMTATLDVEQEVVVAAPREKVFDALCRMGSGGRTPSGRARPCTWSRGWAGASGRTGATATAPVRHRDRHPPARAADLQAAPWACAGRWRVHHGPGGAARRHPGAALAPRRRPDRRGDLRRLPDRLGEVFDALRGHLGPPADCGNGAVAWTLT